MRTICRSVTTVLVFGLLSAGTVSRSVGGPLGAQARIAFQSDRGGNRDIYVMDADGDNLTALTNHLAGDFEPDWAPDGTKVVFASDRDSQFRGHVQLYVVDVQRLAVERVTDDMKSELNPRWSPDGRSIAFMTAWRVGGEPRREIHLLDWRTRERHVLLRDDSLDGDGIAWSPDGRVIAFSSFRERGNQELYLLDVAGGGVRRLTNSPDMDRYPAFSPDGQRILFVSLRNGGVATVHISDVDRWAPIALPAIGWEPAWSPNGEQFLFSRWDLAKLDTDIYVADAEGRRQRNLTDKFGADSHPDWLDPSYVRGISPAGQAAVTWGSLKRPPR
jgi:TolB protein